MQEQRSHFLAKRVGPLVLAMTLAAPVSQAGIVQVSSLAQRKSVTRPGTTIHETRGYWITRPSAIEGTRYQPRPVYRFVYEGTTREGPKQYLRLRVHNLFMEEAARANRPSFHSSKQAPSRLDLAFRATVIELLVPFENGRATFPFPVHVVTPSNRERVPVTLADMEVRDGGLRVTRAESHLAPASQLPWLPPREWPSHDETVYCGREEATKEIEPLGEEPPPLLMPAQ